MKQPNPTGPSALKVSLGYTGPLLAQTILDKTGTDLLTKAELDWTYSGRLLVDSESLTVTQSSPSYSVRSAFDYDADGLPKCIAQSASAACDSSATSIAGGKVEKIIYDGSVAVPTSTQIGIITDTYGYDKFNGLASIASNWSTTATPPVVTNLYTVTYDDGTTNTSGSRDALGRVQRKTEVRGPSGASHTYVSNYTYDNSGRLWTVNDTIDGVASPQRTYTYDSDGNRNFPNVSYDAQDRLNSFGTGSCPTATCFTYSSNGELATKFGPAANNTYTYDVFGNLRNVNLGGLAVIDYLVDGLGRRVGKKVGGALKQEFVYRGTGLQIAAEIDSTSQKLKSRFFYGSRPNVPDFMERANGTNATKMYRIISDQLGSPVLVVNTTDSTDVLLDVRYDEWGNIICRAQPSNGADCAPDGGGPCNETKCTNVIPFGFAGGLYDPDTGFVRFGARDYDPSIGRWVSKDPILFGGGQGNLYVYVGNNPTNRADPSGTFGIGLGGSGGGGWGAGAEAGGGIYVGTEGFGTYGSISGDAGFGAFAGAGWQVNIYSSLAAFDGTSVGLAVVLGAGIVSSVAVTGNQSGATLTLGGGYGAGAFAGGTASTVWIHPLTLKDVVDLIWKTASTERPEHPCP